MAFEKSVDRGSSYRLTLYLLFAILPWSLPSSVAQNTSTGDTAALLQFKTFTDGGRKLDLSWIQGTDPCNSKWIGIRCGIIKQGERRVTKLLMQNLHLNGTIPENCLGNLTELRMLDLSDNSFSGKFPDDLSNLNLAQFRAGNSSFSSSFPNITRNSTKLVRLYLQKNNLSGPIPDLSLLPNLMELDLSYNSFQGSFPSLAVVPTLSGQSSKDGNNISLTATNLQLTLLNLSHNQLTGPIPNLTSLLNLRELNLSNNGLNGSVPSTLPSNLTVLDLSFNSLSGTIPSALYIKFPFAFQGDPKLCGPGTNLPCAPAPAPAPALNPASAPATAPPPQADGARSATPPVKNARHVAISTRNAVFIAVGGVVLVGLTLVAVKYFSTKRAEKSVSAKPTPERTGDSGAGAGMSSMGGDSDRSKLSFIDDSQQGYDLEDLLRASAEMLGKGSFGTAYKAVMESGMIVAVKRLRDVKDVRRNEFSQHMELLGRLKHPNIVPLRAYYYAREEKLLIYDFMPNGSLFSLLHGSRGPGRTPLEWPARLSIAQGIAKGLIYLHQECGHKIPHANIKSSNVLMGKNFEVCISDFGLLPLIPSQIAAQRMAGYRAPEYSPNKKLTYKADVYSFGVLLLELLTGRQPAQSISDNGVDLPKWVQSVVREEWTGEVFDLELKSYAEEEMVTLLQVAMGCVEPKPEERPDMIKVVEMLEGIRRGESVLDSESYQSQSTEADYSGFDLPQSH